MIYQEELRAPETVAVWVGDMLDEDGLISYLAKPFEDDFGIILNDEDPLEYACSYPKPHERRRCLSTRPFESLPVSELLAEFPLEGDWRQPVAGAARAVGIDATKAVIILPSLRYRPELIRNPSAQLRFLGNFPWPEGREFWAASESLRLRHPPFPILVRRLEAGGLFVGWKGILRLSAWDGFAHREDLTRDGWTPSRGQRAGGDLTLHVEPPSPSASLPSEEQTRTLRELLDAPDSLRSLVLGGIFSVYASWRDDHFGSKVSSDGGATWQTGWDLPEQYPPDQMPAVRSPEELCQLIRPGAIYVMSVPKDGSTRLGFGFQCRWDEEHGLGVSVHNGEIVSVGDAAEAFSEFPQRPPSGE